MTTPVDGASGSCIRCRSALGAGDLRCAVCSLPVPTVARPRHYRVVYPQVLRCRECHAALAFVPAAAAPRCGFCGATMAIEQPLDPIEAADRHVPFAVSRVTAEAALRGWLATRGVLAPRALGADARIESLAPLYWAAWVVSAGATVTWAADSSEGARRSAWAPHAGEVAMRFEGHCIPATRGLTAPEAAQLAAHYDLGAARDLADRARIPTAIAPEAAVEQFDLQRRAARGRIQRVLDVGAARRIRPHIAGTRVRNVRTSAVLDAITTDRVGLPVWIFSYRHRGRTYRALVHGTRPGVVLGRAPVSRRKLALAVLLALALAYWLLLR